ncbi:MAG: DsrE family protein [Candidatus Eisenbacteria bacterium]|nr:DsrE family protein [Candidatus Eisenbacteria bacterium]
MTPAARDGSLLLLLTRDGMGSGEPELQHKLIRTYLGLLEENGMLPGTIAFYTEGVRLVVEGSPVLDLLEKIERAGVHLVICKTCLDYYGLTEQVKVGVVGGMTDIIEAQWRAAKVITL